MSAQAHPKLTPEEYLARDRAAEVRSEYYDGHIYAMSGASLPHGVIVGNLTAELRNRLRGRDCRVVPNDLRVRVTARAFSYPDVVVTCGAPRLADDRKDDRKDVLLNPTLLVEVLSPSTENYDRGLKFTNYRRLDSLQEYVLVSQSEPRIEVYRRQPDGKWLLTETSGLQTVARFDSLDCDIPLSEIYYQVQFDQEPEADV
jgi:Uma2 family endonuclease